MQKGLNPARQQVVIDEIQKVPPLLDEVHWLIENRGLHFALCGSSARKVKRGAANLLGGRATALRACTASRLQASWGDKFELDRMLNHGYLPRIYEASQPKTSARCVHRGLPQGGSRGRRPGAQSSDLLRLPGCRIFERRGDRQLLDHRPRVRRIESHDRRAIFRSSKIRCWRRWLPAYRKRPEATRDPRSPKFYFVDVGVVNQTGAKGRAARRDRSSMARAFENWVFHELSAFASYREFDGGLSYWRLASGIEVDFI